MNMGEATIHKKRLTKAMGRASVKKTKIATGIAKIDAWLMIG